MKLIFRISILNRYIISELLPPLYLGLIVFAIIGELVGISFEQLRFIIEQNISFSTSFLIHLLKLTFFISFALPFALLLSTILTYTKLALNNEITSFQSFGISKFKIILPALFVSIFFCIIVFFLNAILIPKCNYQAAIVLEKAVGISRDKYLVNNLVYKEFKPVNSHSQILSKKTDIDLIVYAAKFEQKVMSDPVVIKFLADKTKEIIMSHSATWNENKNLWEFQNGIKLSLSKLVVN